MRLEGSPRMNGQSNDKKLKLNRNLLTERRNKGREDKMTKFMKLKSK